MWRYTIILVILLAAPLSALAAQDTMGVSSTVPVVLSVTYTGSATITFELTDEDFCSGEKTLNNQGNLNWTANITSWDIKVKRNGWQKKHGSQWQSFSTNLPLQVGGNNISWHTVTTSYTTLKHGTTRGSGSYTGIDWRMTDIGYCDNPGPPGEGMYRCTVTFTISAGS